MDIRIAGHYQDTRLFYNTASSRSSDCSSGRSDDDGWEHEQWPVLHRTNINIRTISSLCKHTAQAAAAAGHMTNDAGCTKYGCNHRLYHDHPPPPHRRHNNSRFLIVSIISSSAQSLVEQPARPRDPGQTVTIQPDM